MKAVLCATEKVAGLETMLVQCYCSNRATLLQLWDIIQCRNVNDVLVTKTTEISADVLFKLAKGLGPCFIILVYWYIIFQ